MPLSISQSLFTRQALIRIGCPPGVAPSRAAPDRRPETANCAASVNLLSIPLCEPSADQVGQRAQLELALLLAHDRSFIGLQAATSQAQPVGLLVVAPAPPVRRFACHSGDGNAVREVPSQQSGFSKNRMLLLLLTLAGLLANKCCPNFPGT